MAQKYTFYSFVVFFLRKMNKILLIYHTYRLIVCKNVTPHYPICVRWSVCFRIELKEARLSIIAEEFRLDYQPDTQT